MDADRRRRARLAGRAARTAAVGVAALAAGTVLVACQASGKATGGGPGTTAATAGPDGKPRARPAANQVFLTGTLRRVKATGVRAPALPLPLTLQVADRYQTGAQLTGGVVDGRVSAVVWDGGRPLPITGEGSLDLNGPVDVDLAADKATYHLGGADRALTAGRYALGATVAVGAVGLGTPRSRVVLTVVEGTVAAVRARGDVTVSTPARPLALRGPGGLVLEGDLQVESRTGTAPATGLRFPSGALELDLAPVPGGYRIERGVLQGAYELGA